MVRGVVVLITTAFTLAIGFFVATAVLEPIFSIFGDFAVMSSGPVDGVGLIADIKRVALQWMPLIILGGISLWAFRWYLRRERTVRRQR